MNPIVVIATHKRISITKINIELLLQQGVKIVLVVSDSTDFSFFSCNFPEIEIVLHPNYPLGKKWQAGVDHARKLDHSHLIVTGSDDILSKDFMKFQNDYDFIGFKVWYILSGKKLYKLEYLADQPLGGGRIYSKKLLEKIDYTLFDCSKNKLLDDLGWLHARSTNEIISSNPDILAVKGNWPVMNPLDLKHKNVKLLNSFEGKEMKEILKNKFNYAPEGIL